MNSHWIPRAPLPAAGSSGSTAAARSPTSSRAGPTARSSRTSCCRRTPSATATPRSHGIRELLGLARRRADPGRRDRRGEDGHDGRDQRAARAQGRAHGCSSSRAASRDALRIAYQNRPQLFERQHRAAGAALRARGRGRRAHRRARRGRARRSTRRGASRDLRAAYDDGIRAVAIVLMHGYRYPAARAARSPRSRARIGFTQVSVSHEVSPLMKLVVARRHDGRRRLPVADPAPLRRRRSRARAARGVRAAVHAVDRRAHRRAPLPGQGRDPVGPGGRHRRRGARCRGSPASTGSSASTWAARRPTSRTTPASTSARSRPRSPACACARR